MIEDDSDYQGPVPARLTDGWGDTDRKHPDSRKFMPRGPRSKKNTKKWCKGKVGQEHTLAYDVDTRYAHSCYAIDYIWFRRGKETPVAAHWRCAHIIRCTTCGKIADVIWQGSRCPDYPGDDVVRAQVRAQND